MTGRTSAALAALGIGSVLQAFAEPGTRVGAWLLLADVALTLAAVLLVADAVKRQDAADFGLRPPTATTALSVAQAALLVLVLIALYLWAKGKLAADEKLDPVLALSLASASYTAKIAAVVQLLNPEAARMAETQHRSRSVILHRPTGMRRRSGVLTASTDSHKIPAALASSPKPSVVAASRAKDVIFDEIKTKVHNWSAQVRSRQDREKIAGLFNELATSLFGVKGCQQDPSELISKLADSTPGSVMEKWVRTTLKPIEVKTEVTKKCNPGFTGDVSTPRLDPPQYFDILPGEDNNTTTLQELVNLFIKEQPIEFFDCQANDVEKKSLLRALQAVITLRTDKNITDDVWENIIGNANTELGKLPTDNELRNNWDAYLQEVANNRLYKKAAPSIFEQPNATETRTLKPQGHMLILQTWRVKSADSNKLIERTIQMPWNEVTIDSSKWYPVAWIRHDGSSMKSGHYSIYIRPAKRINTSGPEPGVTTMMDDKVWQINDDRVTVSTSTDLIEQGTDSRLAYVLLCNDIGKYAETLKKRLGTQTMPQGFRGVSNLCYFNSIMQMLMLTDVMDSEPVSSPARSPPKGSARVKPEPLSAAHGFPYYINDEGKQVVYLVVSKDCELMTIGGNLDKGETPWQAFVREFEEETGNALDEKKVSNLHAVDFTWQNKTRTRMYAFQVPENPYLIYDRSKVKDGETIDMVAYLVDKLKDAVSEPNRFITVFVKRRLQKITMRESSRKALLNYFRVYSNLTGVSTDDELRTEKVEPVEKK